MTLDEGFFHRRGFETIPRSALPEKTAGDCLPCARWDGCREFAVRRVLRAGVPEAGGHGRRLRVLLG